MALAPAMASAAVKFDSVTLSESTSADAGAASNTKNPSKTYTSLATVKAGVSKTAESTVSNGGGHADAVDSDAATFNSKRQGVLGITQSATTSSNKTAGFGTADASGDVSYQFELTGPKIYRIALDGIMSGSTTGNGGLAGDLIAQLKDGSGTFLFASTGTSFSTYIGNLTAGTYTLELINSSDSFSTSLGKPDADSASAFGLLAFNIAVPEPATWTMMLLGLSGIGAVARRRRRLEAEIAAA